MKGLLISNFFNHHQKYFCDAVNAIHGEELFFLQTTVMPQEKISLGYRMDNYPYYVINAEGMKREDIIRKYSDLLMTCDYVLSGDHEEYVINRIKERRLTYIMGERWCKKKKYGMSNIREYLHFWKHHNRYQCEWVYDLGISAYYAYDMKKHFANISRTYNWAYFPESVNTRYVKKKEGESIKIAWVSRFIDWKHPESVLALANKLRMTDIKFRIYMIGEGILLDYIRNEIKRMNLDKYIELIGAVPFQKVRDFLNESDIYISTSDRNEGWGVTINEAMNSSCAIVASHAIGSVPLLIQNGINGYIYKDGDSDDLFCKVETLCKNRDLRIKFGKLAFDTIYRLWNPEVAAKRLIEFSNSILTEQTHREYTDGPLSKATIIDDNWIYKTM